MCMSVASVASFAQICICLIVRHLFWRKKSLTCSKWRENIPYVACASLCQFFLFGQICCNTCLCLASLSNTLRESFLPPLYKNSQILCPSKIDRMSDFRSEYIHFPPIYIKHPDAITSQDYPYVGYPMTLDNFSPIDYLKHSKASNSLTFLHNLSTGLRVRPFLFNQCLNVVQLE